MSRIYDALKRAAEEARRRDTPAAPQAVEKPPVEAPEPPLLPPAAKVTPIPHPEPKAGEPVPDILPRDLRAGSVQREEPAAPPKATPEPRTYREQVRKMLRERLAQERETMAAAGKYSFEGNWLTIEEIRALRRRLRLKDFGILFQLILLFLIMAATGVLFHRVLVQFFLPGAA